MTAVRFLLDEHMSNATRNGLRARGIECLTVHEAGRRSGPDADHLSWAASEGWIIVTHDGPFVGLAHQTSEHGGPVYCPGGKYPLGAFIEALAELVSNESMESLNGRVVYL